MRKAKKTLAVVYDKFEAEQALDILKGNDDFEIIALTLDAEFYVADKLASFKNPLYNLIEKSYQKNSDYIFDNFKISYRWANNTEYQYIRDRLGYYLAEFDRSFDFATRAINLYKPKKLIIGSQRDFVGSSVIFGTLKTNAFYLLAKERKIPFILIKSKLKPKSLKQAVGELLHSLRTIKKQATPNGCDVLLLATARQLCQIENLASEMNNSRINVSSLTYNVTLEYKKKLKFLSEYLEKEKIMDNILRSQAKTLYENFLAKKNWQKFFFPKYQNHKYVINSLKKKVEQESVESMGAIFQDIVLADYVLKKIKPKILLTLTDPDTKVLPYINKAKDLGIKTVCIQHGAIYPFDSPAIYPVSDFFVAWSKLSKAWLQRNSYFKKTDVLVGQSPFHRLKKYENVPTKTGLRILYLNTAHLVDQGLINFHLKSLFQKLNHFEKPVNIYLRLHPNQVQYSWNLDWVANLGRLNVLWANNESLENALGKVDLVIFEDTTAGFDAMLAGKPTIYYNPYTGEDFFNVGKNKASLAILSEKDMGKFLEFLKDYKKQRKFSLNGYSYAKNYLGLDTVANRNVVAIKKIINLK